LSHATQWPTADEVADAVAEEDDKVEPFEETLFAPLGGIRICLEKRRFAYSCDKYA